MKWMNKKVKKKKERMKGHKDGLWGNREIEK